MPLVLKLSGTAIIDSPSSRGAGVRRGVSEICPRGPSLAGYCGVPAGVKIFGVPGVGYIEVGVDVGEEVKEGAEEGVGPEGREVKT